MGITAKETKLNTYIGHLLMKCLFCFLGEIKFKYLDRKEKDREHRI
jgi:hypothetical protein